jgi:uncharacterized membrane protein
LLRALALVFTGLGIVLALTALTTGNMASRFSPRLPRMRLRTSGNKWVLATFAETVTFIITSQVLLRTVAGDDLEALRSQAPVTEVRVRPHRASSTVP